jgi:hypothetical protein
MRIEKIESRHTFSIYLPTSLYEKLVNKAGRGKINTFIREVLEEKLLKEEQNKKEQLKQQLIKGYQAVARSKKRQNEDEIWDETSKDGLK